MWNESMLTADGAKRGGGEEVDKKGVGGITKSSCLRERFQERANFPLLSGQWITKQGKEACLTRSVE